MSALFEFLHKINLPNPKLKASGKLSNEFLGLGVIDFYHAIDYVHSLSYGRTSERANYYLVFREKRGACSTKHALISELANELAMPVHLCLGLFVMDAINTPKIMKILKKNQLKGVPEAHCFLQYQNQAFDITFPDINTFEVKQEFIQATTIAPADIGDFKVKWHRHAIEEWLSTQKINYTLDEIWSIRENCIAALQSKNCYPDK